MDSFYFAKQDYRQPTTVQKDFNGIPFEAVLADDIPALELVRQSGADGFTMNSNALYQVTAFFTICSSPRT